MKKILSIILAIVIILAGGAAFIWTLNAKSDKRQEKNEKASASTAKTSMLIALDTLGSMKDIKKMNATETYDVKGSYIDTYTDKTTDTSKLDEILTFTYNYDVQKSKDKIDFVDNEKKTTVLSLNEFQYDLLYDLTDVIKNRIKSDKFESSSTNQNGVKIFKIELGGADLFKEYCKYIVKAGDNLDLGDGYTEKNLKCFEGDSFRLSILLNDSTNQIQDITLVAGPYKAKSDVYEGKDLATTRDYTYGATTIKTTISWTK